MLAQYEMDLDNLTELSERDKAKRLKFYKLVSIIELVIIGVLIIVKL